MTPATATDGAQRRRETFFRGTRLDETSASPAAEAREREAVAVIIANVVAIAGTRPTTAQLDHAATIAQRFVRGLHLHALHNMATHQLLIACAAPPTRP